MPPIGKILWSLDFLIATGLGVVVFFMLPADVPNSFASDSYSVAISILSIVFSVFFASQAVIMASSHDDFIEFLDEEKEYTHIVASFRFTLYLQFLTLMVSIALYLYTSYLKSSGIQTQVKMPYAVFLGMFLYSLFAVVMATRETLQFSKYRSEFIRTNAKKCPKAPSAEDEKGKP